MTTVNCYLAECIYNKDYTCTRDVIDLDEYHACEGGCDEGWAFPEEDEED